MQGRLVLLCPGQGAQHPAMFDLARTSAQAAAMLDESIQAAQLGVPLDRILSDTLLFCNRMAQPLIVAATMATWEAIRERVPAPSLVAGYSIGEVAAWGVAGALSARELVPLAAGRARLMNACLETTPGQTLVAIAGLQVRAAAAELRKLGFYVAIETGEDSFIAGGLAAGMSELQRWVEASGGRANALRVEVASHTLYMRPAVEPFRHLLERQHFTDPAVPVLSGISAEPLYRVDKAIDHLARQLAETIRWKDCMDALVEAGVTVALELGPGATLARMLQGRHPQIACRSVADFRSLDGVVAWLTRQLE
ncbi:MAG TPA: acyltransferase domain-containing protein [Telluria sp.]|nr:acyltransferase domain-containing protein [Telluria sp.]